LPAPPALPEGRLYALLRWLDLFFGRGVDDAPAWLLAVRLNVLLFAALVAAVALSALASARRPAAPGARRELATVLALTVLAALLRFAVAPANLLDFGGIPYSRMLFGYPGHFGAAQLYALVYERSARDIEHAIFLNRVAGTLTVPLIFALCRRLRPRTPLTAVLAALLFAVSPLHVLFSASDALAIVSIFLAALSYTLLAGAEQVAGRGRVVRYLAAFTGLALLTQVRYENALLLVPAALFLFVRRRALRLTALAPALVVAAAFLAMYGGAALLSPLSYQNPVNLEIGFARVAAHLLRNSFLTLPVLFFATVAVALRRSVLLTVAALLPWIPALALPALAESGHGTARVFCTWLVLLLPFAGDGLAALLGAVNPLLRLLGAAAVSYLAAQPLLLREPLTAQYLEMREHVAFRAGLRRLPASVRRVIVPDDEVQRRRAHSTVELSRKYALTVAGAGMAGRVDVVGLSDFLENPTRFDCDGGACAFFFGLPCLEQAVYPYAPPQCAQMLRERNLSEWERTAARGAPFLGCAVYAGETRAELCDPTVLAGSFIWYGVAP